VLNLYDFDHPSVLVPLFEGRIFKVVESHYGGTDRQHRNVVFPRFFNLAEPTCNVEKSSFAMSKANIFKKAP
jgi:hypothetical protein